jgi:hypothetical protein
MHTSLTTAHLQAPSRGPARRQRALCPRPHSPRRAQRRRCCPARGSTWTLRSAAGGERNCLQLKHEPPLNTRAPSMHPAHESLLRTCTSTSTMRPLPWRRYHTHAWVDSLGLSVGSVAVSLPLHTLLPRLHDSLCLASSSKQPLPSLALRPAPASASAPAPHPSDAPPAPGSAPSFSALPHSLLSGLNLSSPGPKPRDSKGLAVQHLMQAWPLKVRKHLLLLLMHASGWAREVERDRSGERGPRREEELG